MVFDGGGLLTSQHSRIRILLWAHQKLRYVNVHVVKMVKFLFIFSVFEFNVYINAFQLEYPTVHFIVWKVFGTLDAKQAKRETKSACRTIISLFFKVFRPTLLTESIFPPRIGKI